MIAPAGCAESTRLLFAPVAAGALPPRRASTASALFSNVTDAEALGRAQGGERAAAEHLLAKYHGIVRARVRPYFLVGAEKDDLLQIGAIGLWQAIVDYRAERAIGFPAFASICVTRHIITAVKASTRLKQLPLNNSLVWDESGEPREFGYSAGQRAAPPPPSGGDPETALLRAEDERLLASRLQSLLSEFEWQVLSRFQAGHSYREIAGELGCKSKSIDNALVRVKRKVGGASLLAADGGAPAV